MYKALPFLPLKRFKYINVSDISSIVITSIPCRPKENCLLNAQKWYLCFKTRWQSINHIFINSNLHFSFLGLSGCQIPLSGKTALPLPENKQTKL